MQFLRREKKKSMKLKQKIVELETERDSVPLKIRKQLSRMVVCAFDGGKAEIFLLDQIQNYGKLQGARWTEITIAHCIIWMLLLLGLTNFCASRESCTHPVDKLFKPILEDLLWKPVWAR